MDSQGKKEFLRTAIIVVFFLVLAIVLLDLVIGNAMDPVPPSR
jgi:preprotein translocase subunit SecE